MNPYERCANPMNTNNMKTEAKAWVVVVPSAGNRVICCGSKREARTLALNLQQDGVTSARWESRP